MRIWRTARRDRRVVLALALFGLLALVALASLFLPYGSTEQNVGGVLEGSSFRHPMGTDNLGRDVFSRVAAGARLTLAVSAAVLVGSLLIGTPIGVAAGYLGGKIDSVFGRIADFLLGFPSLLMALLLTVVLGPGLRTVVIALVIVFVPTVFRFARGAAQVEAEQDYVASARVTGTPTGRIMLREVLPNIASQMLVLSTIVLSSTVLAEAALSFLGFGAQAPTSSWGKMMTEYRQFISRAPHLVLFPGAAVAMTVFAFNLLGDGLRDVLDPRQTNRGAIGVDS